MLSTDMFTLIDEDAIVPYDDLVKTDDDKSWLAGFTPVFRWFMGLGYSILWAGIGQPSEKPH